MGFGEGGRPFSRRVPSPPQSSFPSSIRTPMQQLFLKKHEDRRLRAGHLWIFSNEVDVKRSPLTAFEPGEAAQVCAADGRTIGTAYVNPFAHRRAYRQPQGR